MTWDSHASAFGSQAAVFARRSTRSARCATSRRRTRNGGLELKLEDDPAGMDLSTKQVLVPARVGKAHPGAARYRDRTDDHLVSRAALARSVRVLHALIIEPELRGYHE
jgi:hypothetical protein